MINLIFFNIFIILLLLFIIYIFYRHYYFLYLSDNIINIDELIDTCNTGDILLFRYKSLDPLHNIISLFSHIGMIYVDRNNKKKIIETHNSGDTKYLNLDNEGVQIYDIKDRIKGYEGNVYLAKNLSQNINNNIIHNKLEMYKNIPFNTNYRNDFINQCLLFSKYDTSPKLQCSQFIGLLLKDLNVLPEDFNLTCLTPEYFLSLKDKNNELIFDITKKIIY